LHKAFIDSEEPQEKHTKAFLKKLHPTLLIIIKEVLALKAFKKTAIKLIMK
jgi:hypothetical protein